MARKKNGNGTAVASTTTTTKPTKKKRGALGEQVSGRAPYDQPASRSAHVRAYLSAHPKAEDRKPSLVVAHFAEHGINVSTATINQLKSVEGKGRRKGKGKRNGQAVSGIAALLAAQKFVTALGGDHDLAREALDGFKKLSS